MIAQRNFSAWGTGCALGAALMLSACMPAPEVASAAYAPDLSEARNHPEAKAFTTNSETDAMAKVDAALASADTNGKRVLLVMGANWCHDSRALAGWLETPRFQAMLADRYEVVFVNIGMPQTGDGHNLAIAKRFGLDTLPGSPNALVLSGDGTLVNAETATSWRNAASRSEDAIYDELVALAETPL